MREAQLTGRSVKSSEVPALTVPRPELRSPVQVTVAVRTAAMARTSFLYAAAQVRIYSGPMPNAR